MKDSHKADILIVGAGMSGLTAAAYLARSGRKTLILEKSRNCGGLVSSFTRDGFIFDTGPRAIGNAGILEPMLEDLEIRIPLVKGEVSTGICGEITHYESNDNISDYIDSLYKLFPEEGGAIRKIDRRIRSYVSMAETLNKVANPFFKNVFKDRKYLFREFLPWLPSFLSVVLRTGFNRRTVEEELGALTTNRSLIDMISQHFFKGTPANFALGYFENYQDYKYPVDGTSRLPEVLSDKVLHEGGEIEYNREICSIDPLGKTVTDQTGTLYSYHRLLWAADLNSLYERMDYSRCSPSLKKKIEREGLKFDSVQPGESVFSLFLAVDRPPEYFSGISRGHFIYTPRLHGLGDLHRSELGRIKREFHSLSKVDIFNWLEVYCAFNSYEISIPVLKDKKLAPENKTGLIVSILFDGELFELVEKAGWYKEFKENAIDYIISNLEEALYPGLRQDILFSESASPLTLIKRFNTSHGAITGWSLEENAPVPSSLAGIMGTARTAVPSVYKAGQWSYSPSGVPIAILTGKIAASAILRKA